MIVNSLILAHMHNLTTFLYPVIINSLLILWLLQGITMAATLQQFEPAPPQMTREMKWKFLAYPTPSSTYCPLSTPLLLDLDRVKCNTWNVVCVSDCVLFPLFLLLLIPFGICCFSSIWHIELWHATRKRYGYVVRGGLTVERGGYRCRIMKYANFDDVSYRAIEMLPELPTFAVCYMKCDCQTLLAYIRWRGGGGEVKGEGRRAFG